MKPGRKLNLKRGCAGNKLQTRFRSQAGMYLIELIVAVAMAGLLAVVLGQSLSANMRMSTGAQNQLLVAEVAQEVLERIRDQPTYNLYGVTNGTYPVHVSSSDGAIASTYPFQVAAMFDESNLTFNAQTTAFFLRDSPDNTVTVTFANGLNPSFDRQITVNVNWAENKAVRTYSLTTMIDLYGIHAY